MSAQCSTDSDGGTVPYSRVLHGRPAPRHPPANFDQAIRLPQSLVNEFKQAGICDHTWEQLRCGGVVLTTDYSGSGTAELAMAMIGMGLADVDMALSNEKIAMPWCKYYRACDSDDVCRYVVSKHTPDTRPVHIMDDMLKRVDAGTRELMGRWLTQALKKFQDAAAQGHRRRSVLVELHGRKFAKKVWAHLETIEVEQTAPCHSCNDNCKVHPSSEERAGRRYMNASGNVCVPWSSLGSRMGWLHEATLVFLVWLKDIIEALPDVVAQECVCNFDSELMNELIQDKYLQQSCTTCPSMFGLPVHRRRKYSICIRKDLLVFDVPWPPGFLTSFFRREVLTSAKIYFRAPQSIVEKHLCALADKRGCRIQNINN